jgi:hypothetical protein
MVQWFLHGWSIDNYKTEIKELKEKNLNQKLIIEAKDKELADKQSEVRVERKIVYVQREVDKMVESGDNAAMRQRFMERGMLSQELPNPPPGGGGRDTGHKAPDPADLPSIH